MSAEIVWLDGAEAATNGVPVERVLEAAKGECEEVVVIGYTKGVGHLYAAASFDANSAERTVFLLEQAKAWLLSGCPEQGE